MESYYTSKLKEKDYDLDKWLLIDLVRQFGVCYSIRDEKADTVADIVKLLSKYDEERKADLEKQLAEASREHVIKSDDEIRKDMADMLASSEKILKRAEVEKEKVSKVREQLNTYIEKAKSVEDESGLLNNLLKLADTQLEILEESVDWDIQYANNNIASVSDFNAYKNNLINTHAWIINQRANKEVELKDKINNFKSNADLYQWLGNTIKELSETVNV